jgi:hypothetical protein
MFVFDNVVDWWRSYAGRAIELQRFARRIVSLCASSSGCERNWSTFEFVSIKYHDFPTAQFVFNFSKIIIFSNFFCRSIQRKEIACYIRD